MIEDLSKIEKHYYLYVNKRGRHKVVSSEGKIMDDGFSIPLDALVTLKGSDWILLMMNDTGKFPQ